MKKLLTLFAAVLMCMCAVIPAKADSREDLDAMVKVVNMSCPEKVDDDITIESVKLIKNNVVFKFVVNLDAEEMNTLKEMEAEMAEELAADFAQDEDIAELLSLCKAAKCNIVFRFANKQDQHVDLTLPYSKM